jgi:hypothetical protein
MRILSLRHCVQTGSMAHPASYPMVTGGKRPGYEVSYLPPYDAEINRVVIN